MSDLMRLSDRTRAEKHYVEDTLGASTICERCGARLETFADSCTADLSDACPGFLAIEQAKEQFSKDNPIQTRNGSGENQSATGGIDGHSAESRNDVKSPSTPPSAVIEVADEV